MESIAGFPEGRALLPSELGFRRWGLLPRDLLLSALLPTLRSEKCRERRRQGAESTFSRWQRLIRVWTRGPSPRAALPCPPPGRAQGLPGAEVPEGREGGSEQVLLTAEGRGGTEPVLSSHHRSAQRVPLKRKTETGSKNVAPTLVPGGGANGGERWGRTAEPPSPVPATPSRGQLATSLCPVQLREPPKQGHRGL